MEEFDNERVLDEEIKPLLDQVKAICARHSMPFLMAIAYRHMEQEVDICTTLQYFGRQGPSQFNDAYWKLMDGRVRVTPDHVRERLRRPAPEV